MCLFKGISYTGHIIPVKPNIKKIESFTVPRHAGINYKPGIWHFPLISKKNMNFLVIDRKGKGNNLVIYNFKKEKIILRHG